MEAPKFKISNIQQQIDDLGLYNIISVMDVVLYCNAFDAVENVEAADFGIYKD